MSTFLKITLGLGVLGVGLLGASATALRYSETVQDRVVARAIQGRVNRAEHLLHEPDALNVVFCGTGSPLPDPERANACIAVYAGERLFIVDAGPASPEQLTLWRLPLGELDGVLMTHFHSDHIGGLGELAQRSWLDGRDEALVVYGPPGVEEVVEGFNMAYRANFQARVDHHGPPLTVDAATMRAQVVEIPAAVEGRAGPGPVVLLDEDELRIQAFPVAHEPLEHAYAYRVDYRGRSVVFSGDTIAHEPLAEFASGVDLLVHEGFAPSSLGALVRALEDHGEAERASIVRDVFEYHTTAVEAAALANEAQVELLAFSHNIPPVRNRVAERVFLRGVAELRPEGVVLADDGLRLRLRADSERIEELSVLPQDLW